MIQELAKGLVELIFDWGYLGIFIMMAIESSFIPFPSEVVLVPAGYLASKGDMSISYILGSALAGSLLGAFINYYLALTLGRRFLLQFGKYFFISPQTLEKMENYFQNHGHISIFTGRLIPGVRQLISIPAGLARMNRVEFALYTSLGAGIWACILTLLGYFISSNEALMHQCLKEITIIVLVLLIILVWVYYIYQKREA